METIEELTKEIKACENSPDCHRVWSKIQHCRAQYEKVYNICMIKYRDVRNTPVRESV